MTVVAQPVCGCPNLDFNMNRLSSYIFILDHPTKHNTSHELKL